jgi:hypothetical protein
MDTPSLWDLLQTCLVADEATWLRHVEGFVAAFIASAKKERWLDQLTRRPRKLARQSYKIHSALDRRVCANVGQWLTGRVGVEGRRRLLRLPRLAACRAGRDVVERQLTRRRDLFAHPR